MNRSLSTYKQSFADKNSIFRIDQKHAYRYERKFKVPVSYHRSFIERAIKHNPFFFREIYNERQVNNIYLDTEELHDYFENVSGVANRKKIRIRWYGSTFGVIEHPVLEIKIKKGLVGDKWSYALPAFGLDDNFHHERIQELFKESDLPLPVLEKLKSMRPVLINSYRRKYFLSADKNFRITLDTDLKYYPVNGGGFSRSMPYRDDNQIIELKYALENEPVAGKVSAGFPFSLSKNSKYVNGINLTRHINDKY